MTSPPTTFSAALIGGAGFGDEYSGAHRDRQLVTVARIFFGLLGGTLIALSSFAVRGFTSMPVPIVPAGQRFQCTPIAVWDGDGPVWCREGKKLRIAGIAAREIDNSCRPGQPCPPASGRQARDRLVGLFGGPTGRWSDGHITVSAPAMNCLSAGQGKGSRTAAWCILANGRNLSCEMIATGTVMRWASYDRENICHVRAS
jgi:endonuclease YncB( thermonuclease family)